MGLNLSMNLPMFVYTFQAMWRHRSMKEYSVFVGIRVACTSFNPYTLGDTTVQWIISNVNGNDSDDYNNNYYYYKNIEKSVISFKLFLKAKPTCKILTALF